MTTIANGFDLNGALRLQTPLESAGIPSFFPDQTMAAVTPHHFPTSSGVRLQVSDEHAEESRKLMEEESPDL